MILAITDPGAEAAAESALRGGEIVALPTETVYGLAVILRDHAVERLLEAKFRDPSRGMALLVTSLAQVEGLALLTEAARRLAARFWPGPLTLVLRAVEGAALPAHVLGEGGTIAVRAPDHPTPRTLAALLGPLVLTSANRSGEPELGTAAAIEEAFGPAVALVLDGGPPLHGQPSTVVDLTRPDQAPRILRPGPISGVAVTEALARRVVP